MVGVLFINLSANENRIVIHGHASHFEKTDDMGTEFNEKNYGIGYEWNSYDGNESYSYIEPVYGISVNIIQDSYKKTFPFAGIFTELRTKGAYGVGVSVSGFIGYKNLIHTNRHNYIYNGQLRIDVTYTGENYDIIGGVTPGFKIYLDKISLNYNYSPEFKSYGMNIDGFHYFSLSYNFY